MKQKQRKQMRFSVKGNNRKQDNVKKRGGRGERNERIAEVGGK